MAQPDRSTAHHRSAVTAAQTAGADSGTSRIAFIGTRDLPAVPPAALDAYRQAALAAAARGATVVTGAAQGADQLAATLAISLGGRVHLVLPWEAYEYHWVRWALAHPGVTRAVYDPPEHAAWTESVFAHHPAGRKLAPGALALHARNFGIVSGADLVIALSKDCAGRHGGTAQGLRVARALGIPAYNLWIERDRTAVAEVLAHHAPVPA
jgi:hypothetical protein